MWVHIIYCYMCVWRGEEEEEGRGREERENWNNHLHNLLRSSILPQCCILVYSLRRRTG